jgi:hypothetical protein
VRSLGAKGFLKLRKANSPICAERTFFYLTANLSLQWAMAIECMLCLWSILGQVVDFGARLVRHCAGGPRAPKNLGTEPPKFPVRRNDYLTGYLVYAHEVHACEIS